MLSLVLPTAWWLRRARAARNSSCSSSGTPSRSATTISVNGLAYSVTSSHSPRSMNSSMRRSASRHTNSSFSFIRLGVSWRISRCRWSRCFGGSMVVIWSLNGSSSRCCSIRSLTSSPSSGTGKPGNGPVTELHDENVSVSV